MQKTAAATMVLLIAWGLVACKPAPAPAPAPESSAAAPATTAPVAGWVVFEAMPDATIYVDPSSIHKEGDRAEMWVLIDYKQAQSDKTGKQVLSDKLQYQYDCAGRQLSIIATSAHAGPMASGEIINISPDPPQLTPIPPGTTAEKMWERACGAATT